MNPFERHGIRHLSPSSLNLYQAEPAMWVAKYLFSITDESGPAAKRGLAVEAGLDHWLLKRERCADAALENFALNTDGLASDDHEAERALIEPMLDQAIAATKDWPEPVARQLRIEHWFDGIEVPVIGYIDYLWQDFGLDLKTTKAMPSSPRVEHVRQVAIYAEAKARPWKLLYVTAKKHAVYSITEEEARAAVSDMERLAKAIRRALSTSADKSDIAEMFVPKWDSFYWSNDNTKAQAAQIWR